MEEKAEEEGAKQRNPVSRATTQKVLIQIPSYEEVIGASQPKSNPSSGSLFQPSQSFSQAFSFIKNSEFYSPPPQPPQPSSQSPSSSSFPDSVSRRLVSAEFSGAAASSSSSQSGSQNSQTRNAILVSHRQKGNPLLKHIRNVRWTFADVVGDYLVGQSSCALYLSLRYHLLHPDYLYYRIRELQKNYKLRVVLCHIDVEDVAKPLLEVTKTALLHDCTLLCAWSLEECGRYLETIKMYENKPADLIQGQMDTDYSSRLQHALTSVRHVNKTDVVTLGSTFGSLSSVMDASMEDLARCPGIGERKVKRLYDTFHEPFKRTVSNYPVVPETPTQGPSLEDQVAEVGVEKEGEEDTNRNKRRKKEPETTVKSALSAAFAKYANKFGKKNSKSQEKKAGGRSSSPGPEGGNSNSKEGESS
ncbi:unnamed protein product [Linum tenue]|uniref:DNA excision repair protein ERCC-1 n=1 Tax=Linum tenue TaxID=586396 RepID=A0AAV0I3X1_9ROSI|nr:unnamed protein product [Linum tenue]